MSWGGWYRKLQEPGDVDKTPPADGQVLVYDAARGVWVPGAGSVAEIDPLSLHIDQTIPQKVVNGTPQFDQGVVIKKDQKLYLDGQ